MIISSLSSLGFFLSERSIRPEFPRSFFFMMMMIAAPATNAQKLLCQFSPFVLSLGTFGLSKLDVFLENF